MNTTKEKTKTSAIKRWFNLPWKSKKLLEETAMLTPDKLASKAKEKRDGIYFQKHEVESNVCINRHTGTTLYSDFPMLEKAKNVFFYVCGVVRLSPDQERVLYYNMSNEFDDHPAFTHDVARILHYDCFGITDTEPRWINDQLERFWSKANGIIATLKSSAKDSIAAAQLYAKEGETSKAAGEHWQATLDYSGIESLYLRFGKDKEAGIYRKLADEQKELHNKHHKQPFESNPSAY